MNVPITLANGNTIELNNITESGKDYIRFSDGTQICYGFNLKQDFMALTVEEHRYFASILYYPKVFIDPPSITGYSPINAHESNYLKEGMDTESSLEYTANLITTKVNMETGRQYQPYTNGCIILYTDVPNVNRDSWPFYYIAIGRWK